MDDNVKQNLKSQSSWKRILYMLLFGFIYSVAEIVVFAVAVCQALSVLITGKRNTPLLEFGDSLSTYLYQILQFFTYNSDEKPFPFADWPAANPSATVDGDIIEHTS